jgi:nitroreductase
MLKAIKKLVKSVFPSIQSDHSPGTYLHYDRCLGEIAERLSRYKKVQQGVFPDDDEVRLSRLRAYAHILDKSLHHPEWEYGRGREIYELASKLLIQLDGHDCPTKAWANEIVSQYEARQKGFAQSPERHTDDMQENIKLCSEDLSRLMANRRSCRQYAERKVERDVLAAMVSAAIEAPSSCSRQTLRVYCEDRPGSVKEVLQYFKGFTGFGSYVPVCMVYGADLRPYGMPKELFVPHLDTGLAAQNAAIMAAAHGVSVTYLSWASHSPGQDVGLRAYFEIPDYVEIVVGCACGYPRFFAMRPQRKRVDSTLIYKVKTS